MNKLYIFSVLAIAASITSAAYAEPKGCSHKTVETCETKYSSCPYNVSLGSVKEDVTSWTAEINECKLNDKNECKAGDRFMRCDLHDVFCLEDIYSLEAAC